MLLVRAPAPDSDCAHAFLIRHSGTEGMSTMSDSEGVVYTVEELECKICYSRYDSRARKPKLLACLHRVCARCLKKMAEMESSPGTVSCPFCRHQTHVPEEEIWLLQDDSNILAILSYQERVRKSGSMPVGEVLLTPNSLSGGEIGTNGEGGGEQAHSSSDCLVITIMEVPGESTSPDSTGMLNMVRLYRPASLDSLPCHVPVQKWRTWTSRSVPRFVMGFLCLLYFSSLPLGIYLLMIQQLTLGVILVSLVPSTLVLCVFYGFCQCLCHEIMEAIAT